MADLRPAAAEDRARRRERQAAAAQNHSLPSLHLLIWPSQSAVRLSLVLYYSTPGQRRTCTVLRDAVWRPKEVTPTKLVEWGQRAMADWLTNPTLTEVGQSYMSYGKGQMGG